MFSKNVFFFSLYHLSVGISENGYPVSDNRTLNCEGVAPSHIKEGETAMLYPFELTQCPPTEIPNSQKSLERKIWNVRYTNIPIY